MDPLAGLPQEQSSLGRTEERDDSAVSGGIRAIEPACRGGRAPASVPERQAIRGYRPTYRTKDATDKAKLRSHGFASLTCYNEVVRTTVLSISLPKEGCAARLTPKTD
jgi:hypothetical protein